MRIKISKLVYDIQLVEQ